MFNRREHAATRSRCAGFRAGRQYATLLASLAKLNETAPASFFASLHPMEKPQVLIIDDNRELADNLREILLDEDLAVDVAYCGEDGLKLAASRPYRVILTDMRMPGIDGSSLVRALKDTRPETPIMVMTAYCHENTIADARKFGAINVFLKPLDASRIADVVYKLATSNRHVLLVEDDDCMRTTVVELVEELDGVVVHPVATRAQALRLLRSAPISAAIIDIRLPDGSGDDVGKALQALHGQRQRIPIVFISGFAHESLSLDCDGGSMAFFEKPFSPSALLARMRQVI